MALFKKNEPQQPQKPRERSTAVSRGQGDAAISIIGSGMKVVGDISTEGTVRVEGQVRGTIRAATAVVLGAAGAIEGNVLTKDAVIGGNVSGSIVASNRLELQSTCTVEGEIRTRAEHLKLEEGARFAGQVHMIEEEPEEPAAHFTEAQDAYAERAGDELEMFEAGEPSEEGQQGGEEEEEDSDSKRRKAEAH